MQYILLPDNAFTFKKPKRRPYKRPDLLLIFSVVAMIAFGFMVFEPIGFLVILCIVLAGLFIGSMYYGFQQKQQNIRNRKHRIIAKTNGFTYHQKTALLNDNSVLANLGIAKNLQDVLTGYIHNVPFTKANFIHVFNNPNNKYDTTTTGTALIIYLERPVPHIYAWSKIVPYRDEAARTYTKKGIKLEGEFGKYYSLTVPKGYERDALYIFTPELMQNIYDCLPGADIELIDSKAIIYLWDFNAIEKEDFERLAEIVAVVGTELIDNTKNYIDDRAVNRSKRSQNILKGEKADEPLTIHPDGKSM